MHDKMCVARQKTTDWTKMESAMRRCFSIVAAAGMIGGMMMSGASAAPTAAGGLGPAAHDNSLVEPVRIYCYNRYTGRFLHWGSCGGGYRRPAYRRPVYYRRPGRTYCYNRYTGRFLHWGRCY